MEEDGGGIGLAPRSWTTVTWVLELEGWGLGLHGSVGLHPDLVQRPSLWPFRQFIPCQPILESL